MGVLRTLNTLTKSDRRRGLPRLSEENININLALVDIIKKVSVDKNVSMGQIALAWIFSSDFDIIPIPGTRNPKHVEDNIAALDINLTLQEKALLDETFRPENVKGLRSPGKVLSTVDQG